MAHDVEDYSGPATLLVDGTEIAVTVQLRGYFQPIDGYFHWYGRVAANEQLSALAGAKKQVTVRTTEGSAEGQLRDPDPSALPDLRQVNPAVSGVDGAGHGSESGGSQRIAVARVSYRPRSPSCAAQSG